jgi:hypothetical protein
MMRCCVDAEGSVVIANVEDMNEVFYRGAICLMGK